MLNYELGVNLNTGMNCASSSIFVAQGFSKTLGKENPPTI